MEKEISKYAKTKVDAIFPPSSPSNGPKRFNGKQSS